MRKIEINTFKNWLLEKHGKRQTRVGDLARDVGRDPDFPVSDDWEEIYQHIVRKSGHTDAPVLALMEAYVKYRDYLEDTLDALRK